MNKFPIRIRIAPAALEEFRASEEGSKDDAEDAGVGGQYAPTHGYHILSRHKGLIQIDDVHEAAEIYYRVCSGSFQLSASSKGDGEGPSYHATACRIADRLRPVVAESYAGIVCVWPAPSGY